MKQRQLHPTFIRLDEDWMNWCLSYRDKVMRENIMLALEQNDRPLGELLIAEYNSQPWATCRFEITLTGHIKTWERQIEYRVRALEALSQATNEEEKQQITARFNQRQLGVNLVLENGRVRLIEGLPVGSQIGTPGQRLSQEIQERRDEVRQRLLRAFLTNEETFKQALRHQGAQAEQSDKQIPQSLRESPER